MEHTLCVDFALMLGCKVASFPSSYLGLLLCKGKPSKCCWDKIIEKNGEKVIFLDEKAFVNWWKDYSD